MAARQRTRLFLYGRQLSFAEQLGVGGHTDGQQAGGRTRGRRKQRVILCCHSSAGTWCGALLACIRSNGHSWGATATAATTLTDGPLPCFQHLVIVVRTLIDVPEEFGPQKLPSCHLDASPEREIRQRLVHQQPLSMNVST